MSVLDYQRYVKELNFKEYEATNAFAYELIMRNEECQNYLKQLHRISQKLLNGLKIYNQTFKKEFQQDQEAERYIIKRWELDNEVIRLKSTRSVFLEEMSNALFILKASISDKKWQPIFLNYLEKQKLLTKYSYLDNFFDPEMEIDEQLLDILIAAVGQIKLMDKYPELSVEKVDPENKLDMFLGMRRYELNTFLSNLTTKHQKELDVLIEEKNNLLIKDYEEVYLRYRRNRRMRGRLNILREKIEAYVSKEFFIDFSNDLYLDYPFFSTELQKELYHFYKNKVHHIYKDIAKDMLPGGVLENGYEIIYEEVLLKVKETFSVDAKAIESIDSIYTEESLHEVIAKNTSEYIFRYTKVEPVFSRPKLFSERFRDIELNFNPNLPKKELVSQFEAIIEAYQSNQLKNQSIYELLGERFNKWDEKIYREKRTHSKQENKIDAKQIKTLVRGCQDLLYTYDAQRYGKSNTSIACITRLSEGKVSSYVSFSKFLIEEKGYKTLLTANR